VKNILYISPFSHIGGGEVSLLILLKNLNRQMFKPLLTCYAEGPLVQHAKKLNIKTIIFKRDSFFSNFILILKIFRYIKENNVHLVHVNCLDTRAGIAAWLARVPFIGHLRVIFPYTWRDRFFVRLSHKVIAVSNAVIDTFCRERPSYREKFDIIPNPVEIPRSLAPVPLRKEYGIPNDTKLVGVIGRIDPWKGYEYFIRSAAIITGQRSDVFFFIIGGVVLGNRDEEKYLDILKSQVDELGLKDHFFFTGFRDDVPGVIKAFNVLVVPSVVLKKDGGEITEGFGRAAVEAMAVEVPVVASNIGGLKEIVEDKVSGILVNPGNPRAIAEAVLSILTDESKARRLGEAGKKRAKELFDVHNAIERVTELYFEVLKKREK
jgi:glycosyltransferase involved in cell wall biosynthesis